MDIKAKLYSERIISIDAFRGITIFTMIFVNELASISNVPQWLGHMPASADGMTFVDVVFPAFLFIVGMSIPFAINARVKKEQTTVKIWKHLLSRTIALIVMGVYMVNAESGFDSTKMLITPALWGLLAYTMPIPIWNSYSKTMSGLWKNGLKLIGIAVLIALYFLYVRVDGNVGMTPKWWGILGLIGWAYVFTVLVYWVTNGRLVAMILLFLICVAGNCLNQIDGSFVREIGWLRFIAGHMTHITLVAAGTIISLLFFEVKQRYKLNVLVLGFGMLFLILGYLLRPYFEVSKIRGTPSWALYSAAICTALFYLLYWIMEQKKKTKWSSFFMPAAVNPLLIYILPGIIYYFNKTVGIAIVPDYLTDGVPGIIWSLIFSILMLYLIKILNKWGVRLRI